MLEHFIREYNINRIFLSCIGLWPFQSKLTRILLPTLCLLLEISYCPFEILMIYNHRDDMEMIFESSYQMILTVAFIVRILNQLWNRDKLQQLYKAMDDHWNIFTSDMEVRILKYYSLISRKFTICYTTLMYGMMSIVTLGTLMPAFMNIVLPLNESRPRLFIMEAELKIDKNENYIAVFSYLEAVIGIGIYVMVSVDTMHIICTAHACSLFSAIGEQVENIILKVNNYDSKIKKCEYHANTKFEFFQVNEKIIHREYVICLKKYQLAIEFVDILNSSYQMLALILLILIIIMFAIIGIRIIFAFGQLGTMAKFTFILMGALMQLMIVCYSGQILMDESQNIFHRAYAAEWYNFSPRIKSLLIITFHKSIVPCGLMAGNIFPLSMATYVTVVRLGMSYFTTFLSIKA